jgi:hypothetical protein
MKKFFLKENAAAKRCFFNNSDPRAGRKNPRKCTADRLKIEKIFCGTPPAVDF